MEVAKQLIAFCHFKGGVGTSFIASNVAIAIAKRNITTCLIDFDSKLPNCHNMLGIKVPQNRSMRGFIDSNDADVNVQNFFINNKAKNEHLYLLSASNDEGVEVLEDINDNKNDVLDILNTARELFNIVIVDLPVDYQNPPVVEVLKQADKVFVVGDQDINTVDNTLRSLKMYKDIDISLSKFSYLPNKYLEGYEIDIEALKETLPIRITEPIPFDYEIALKNIAKSQFICEYPNPLGTAFNSIVKLILVGVKTEAEKKKGFFNFGRRPKLRKQDAPERVKYIISDNNNVDDFDDLIDDVDSINDFEDESEDDWGDYDGDSPDERIEI